MRDLIFFKSSLKGLSHYSLIVLQLIILKLHSGISASFVHTTMKYNGDGLSHNAHSTIFIDLLFVQCVWNGRSLNSRMYTVATCHFLPL